MLLVADIPSSCDATNSKPKEFDLRSLAIRKETVSATATLKDVHRQFQLSGHENLAVVDTAHPIGLCSRSRVAFLMGLEFGSELGFAQNGALPVTYTMVTNPILHRVDDPLLPLLERTLSRDRDTFHEDIVLVDANGGYLGLIPVDRLARLQTTWLARQQNQIEALQNSLRQTNIERFLHVNELRQSEARYRSLFESNTNSFALLGPDGEIDSANLYLSQLLGLTPDVAVRRFEDFVAEPDRSAFARLLADVREPGGRNRVTELSLNLPERGERTVRLCAAWVPEIGQWTLSLEDVTDARLLQVRDHEIEKRSLLESLVGGVAHEVNNKLTPIIGFASLLDGETEPHDATRYGRLISQSAAEASRIVQQLLHLSRPVRAQREVCTIQDVIHDTLTILKFRLRDAGVELRLDLPVEPFDLYADPGQLKQVLMNLCVNAIDAMAGRSIRLLVVTARCDGNNVAFSVRDSGVGIPADNVGQIFHPFFTTKGPSAGTGLGLSICAAVIAQHGGRIDVQSTPGSGAEFTVWIPRTPLHGHAASIPPAGIQDDRLRLGGTVLVVDDEDVIARLVLEILSQYFDCVAEHVTNGAEALRRCKKGDIGLVISDLRMPVMNGIEFYRQLKIEHPELAERFIFMSGNDSAPEFREVLLDFGAPVLPKPFTPVQMFKLLQQFAGKENPLTAALA